MRKLIFILLFFPVLVHGQSLSDLNSYVDSILTTGNGLSLRTNFYRPLTYDALNEAFRKITTYLEDSTASPVDGSSYKVLYVSQTAGGGANEDGSEAHPFDSLSEALAVRNGDSGNSYIINIDPTDYHDEASAFTIGPIDGGFDYTIFQPWGVSATSPTYSIVDVNFNDAQSVIMTGGYIDGDVDQSGDLWITLIDHIWTANVLSTGTIHNVYMYGAISEINGTGVEDLDIYSYGGRIGVSGGTVQLDEYWQLEEGSKLTNDATTLEVVAGGNLLINSGSVLYNRNAVNVNGGTLEFNGGTYSEETISGDTITGTITGYTLPYGILFEGNEFGMTSTTVQDAIVEAYTDVVQDSIEFYKYWNNINSSARLYGGRIWWSSPDTTVAIAAGGGLVKAEDADSQSLPLSVNGGQGSALSLVEWDSVPALPLVDSAYNYIYYDYSLDCVNVTTDFYSISFTQDFTLGRAYREDTVITGRLCGTNAYNFNRRVQLFGEEIFPIVRVPGTAITSEVGTRRLAVTGGILWAELVNRFTTAAINTNTGDTFWYYYTDGAGGWNVIRDSTQIDNVQYDDGGTLTNVINNQYGIHWVYLVHDGSLHVVYGQDSYATVTDAEQASRLSSVPGLLDSYGTLIARIIIERDGPSFDEVLIESDFIGGGTSGASGSITLHNNLNGLQGGTTNEYYHLTQSEYDDLPTTYTNGIVNSGGVVGLGGDLTSATAIEGAATHSLSLGTSGAGALSDLAIYADQTVTIQSDGRTYLKNLDTDQSNRTVLTLSSGDQVGYKVVDSVYTETPNPADMNFDQNYLMSATYTQSGNVTCDHAGTLTKGKYYSFYFDGNNSGTIGFDVTGSATWRLIGITDGGTLDGLHSFYVTCIDDDASPQFEVIVTAVTDTAN